FVLNKESKLVADFTCELVGYRRKGNAWEPVNKHVVAKDLNEFLKLTAEALDNYLKDIPSSDQATRRVRIFLDPFPGERTYELLRQQAEKQGWKVDRKDVTWRLEYPSS